MNNLISGKANIPTKKSIVELICKESSMYFFFEFYVWITREAVCNLVEIVFSFLSFLYVTKAGISKTFMFAHCNTAEYYSRYAL